MNTVQHIHAKGFTLIEIIVAISIFGVIMVSVMSIFLLASQTSGKVEISRVLQQNTKNITEDIAQMLREYGIHDVSENSVVDCSTAGFAWSVDDTKSGNKLCIWWAIEYFVAQKDMSDNWYRVWDMSRCKDVQYIVRNPCRVVRKKDGKIAPITNNKVNISELLFTVANKSIPRVSLQIKMNPSYREGINSHIVQDTDFFFQTSLSERIILHR